MSLHYPNGKKYVSSQNHLNHPQKINYANRGMTLEEDINASNQYYLQLGRAVIHKKPTPVQIVKVDYPLRSKAVIKEAYFRQPSTTDYNGIYQGKYIDFEAKETKNKHSFPLSNFHKHQIEHMRQVLKQNGICFVLLRFSSSDEIYFLDAKNLLCHWDEQQTSGKKSILKSVIQSKGYPIPIGYKPRIDYLSIIDQYYNER